MRNHFTRVLSMLLVFALLVGFFVPASAAENGLSYNQVSNSAVSNPLRPQQVTEGEETVPYADTDVVRVSIVLTQAPTLQAGFSTLDVAENADAMAYRTKLQNKQAKVTAKIEKAIGEELDVVWNLTLAANLISANVQYGQIKDIENISGVKEVIVEARYNPMETVANETAKPNMMVSANMTGATQVWDTGLTGGGTRIAIIDTGLDTDHQSFDPEALAYALMENAVNAGMSYDEYLAEMNLLGLDEIAEKLTQLNVYERNPGLTAEDLYFNMKAPFGYNYLDGDVDITHDNDSQGSHGSHVAGISAANRYLYRNGEYVSAADTISMLGNAPDAQIIVLKVFGKDGGCYQSDYMAAIEDAIVLGCDAINLSLGTDYAGFVTPSVEYQELMDYLVETDAVVVMASGNMGYWAQVTSNAINNLYIEDVNMQTAGSPGTYANALTVGSVENDGYVGPALQINGHSIGYSDGQGTNNRPLTSLDTTGTGTDYEYVFIDGIGLAFDYQDIDVDGKVVFVSRGETNFADKALEAYNRGAVAIVIYNNIVEGINMMLDGYAGEAPCVLISKAQGEYVRANSQAVTTASGKTYFVGTLTVKSGDNANYENTEFYTMSGFSSWGVPGDLSLKPEITAPGGNIYSVNGNVPETDQYELMSGTSMATPQISGFVALMKQALRERGLSVDGMTDRALIQSILMSTAKALVDGDGNYYAVMQQGAGLVDILAAATADSYVLVDGVADGKVKVELGDDPSRTGVYTFTFSINNLDGTEKRYNLSAAMFTQGVFAYFANLEAANNYDTNNLALYMDAATVPMEFTAEWASNGSLEGNVVTVPANGQVNVTVTLTLTEEEKAFLDEYYVNGAYVEAFVFADAVANEEGMLGTSHSIPVLGFYGNWTDPSMYEKGSVQTYATGEETADPYTQNYETNSLSVEYAKDPGYYYYLGGNPVEADDIYHPERNAFNNTNGDKIYDMQINTIRNAAASRLLVTNTSTGEVLKRYQTGNIYGAYYGVVLFMYFWLEGYYSYNMHWSPKNVTEGDVLEFRVDTAPEYYVDARGRVDWNALGEGASMTIPVTIDNTNPVIANVNVDVENNKLTIEASDNQYVAAVALFNGSGKEVLSYVGSKEDAVPGETYAYELDLSKANGNKFLIQVYDYAYNITTYELRMELGTVPPLPEMIAFDKEYDYYWTSFDKNSVYYNLTIYCETEGIVYTAATIYDHYVFATGNNGDLYVMPEYDLSDRVFVRNLGLVFEDMAYNAADDKVYGVAYNDQNESVLYTVDVLTGALTEVGTLGMNTNTLACDTNGTFYCNEYGTSAVYSFTLDTMHQPAFLVEALDEYGKAYQTMGHMAMEYNAETGKVMWLSYFYEEKSWGTWDYCYLNEIDPVAKTNTLCTDLMHNLVALIIPQEGQLAGDWANPTNEIQSVDLMADEMTLMRGYSARLKVSILPWTVFDHSVTWTSSDPSVVEVNPYGLITALKTGTATVTVTSVLDPSLSDSITVHVTALPVHLEGVLLTEDSEPVTFTWDMLENDNWSAGMALDTVLLGATKTANGDLIGLDASAATFVYVDMTTGKTTTMGSWDGQFYDFAYSKLFSQDGTPRVHMIVDSQWLPAKNPSDTFDTECWDLFDYLYDSHYAFEFVSIAVGDIVTVEDQGNTYQAEELFLLDDQGYIWKLQAYFDGEFYNSTEPVCYASNLKELGFSATRLDETLLTLCSMVVGDDGNLYFSGYTGSTNEFFRFTFNEETQRYDVVSFANAGADVWPAILTDVTTEKEEPACEHKNVEVKDAHEATCTENGYTGDTYCADCGELLAKGEVVEATGHEMGEWVVYTEATCTENGEERSYCAHCDHFESRTVAAFGHEMGEWVVYTEATCTEDGEERSYCAHCDHFESRTVEAKGHSYKVTDTKEATCTEDGHTTYTCDCGDTYTVVTEAFGHNYVDGACEHCGEADSDNPPTGDVNVFALALAAMCVAAPVVICAKKRHN